MSEGLVVASCGLNSRIDSKSPVSATTRVNFLSWSSWLVEVAVGASAMAVLIMRKSRGKAAEGKENINGVDHAAAGDGAGRSFQITASISEHRRRREVR